jgi:hypothetical protein
VHDRAVPELALVVATDAINGVLDEEKREMRTRGDLVDTSERHLYWRVSGNMCSVTELPVVVAPSSIGKPVPF